MSTYGLFQPSVLGMQSQSHAMEAIASNISNIRTGGYKRTDVEFATVLSRTVSSQPGSGDAPAGTNHADLGGARPVDRPRISLSGLIQPTDRELDVAINGRGFFVVNTQPDGSGETLFGRDGRFSVTAPLGGPAGGADGYVVDKNGYYVQGYASPSGTAGAGTFETMRLPPDLRLEGAPTMEARLGLNLPAQTAAGETQTHIIDVFDSTGGRRDLSLSFTRSPTPNIWTFDVTAGAGDTVTIAPSSQPTLTTTAGQSAVFDALAGTITIQETLTGIPVPGAFAGFSVGDAIDVGDTTQVDGSYLVAALAPDLSAVTLAAGTPLPAGETVDTPVTFAGPLTVAPLAFRPDGYLDGPDAYTIDIAHLDGAASAFTLDIATFTQFGGPLLPVSWDRDGFPPGELESLEFDAKGNLIGNFDNAESLALYRLAMADFANADGLEPRNGNVYSLSGTSGDPRYGSAGDGTLGALLPAAHELSNVDLAQEFTRMTMTQSAYNASATTFKTVDEMTQTARDLR